jgi:hypothetical protein
MKDRVTVDELARFIDPIAFDQVSPEMYGLKSQKDLETKTFVGPVRNVARDKARALFDAFNITRKEQIR